MNQKMFLKMALLGTNMHDISDGQILRQIIKKVTMLDSSPPPLSTLLAGAVSKYLRVK